MGPFSKGTPLGGIPRPIMGKGKQAAALWRLGMQALSSPRKTEWTRTLFTGFSTRPGVQRSSQEASLCRGTHPHVCSPVLMLGVGAGLQSGACSTLGSGWAPTSHTCKLILKSKSPATGHQAAHYDVGHAWAECCTTPLIIGGCLEGTLLHPSRAP